MGHDHKHHKNDHHDHDHGHGEGQAKHSSVKLYWTFCVILCAITAMEWQIFKHREVLNLSKMAFGSILMGMSFVKFAMVVGWYMHLRYDHNWVKYIFMIALAMGGATGLALTRLM